MKTLNTKRNIILLSVSLFFFFYMTGFSLNYLNPRNIDWIFFQGNDDASISWFGYEYFRWTDFFQYPILNNYPYGQELNISLVYTGSIPIVSLILKPFDTILGFPFQFIGIYHLICLFLQAYFTIKILDLFVKCQITKFLFVSIVLLSPILPFNLLVNHLGLFGHWIIIASIYLYLIPQFKYTRWISLLILSLLTQAYLFAMILPIFFADLFRRRLNKEINNHNVFLYSVYTFLSIGLIFLLIGVDTSNETYSYYQGYGNYRMNLNSIFDPSVSLVNINTDSFNFSKLIPNLTDTTNIKGSGDYEGFNFIGTSMILIILTTIINYKKNVIKFSKENYLPILIACLFLFIFALSHKVILNDSLLVSYPLPSFAKKLFGVFRSSGRFFWPVMYIITFFSFYIFYKSINPKKIIPILIIIISIGFIDSSQVYTQTRALKSFNLNYSGHTWKQMLKDPKWEDFGKSYNSIKYIYPEMLPIKNYREITLFAVTEGLSVNGGYFARIKKSSLRKVKADLKLSLEACIFDPSSLYIFTSKKNWEKASLCDAKNETFFIDNTFIIAPTKRVAEILR